MSTILIRMPQGWIQVQLIGHFQVKNWTSLALDRYGCVFKAHCVFESETHPLLTAICFFKNNIYFFHFNHELFSAHWRYSVRNRNSWKDRRISFFGLGIIGNQHWATVMNIDTFLNIYDIHITSSPVDFCL